MNIERNRHQICLSALKWICVLSIFHLFGCGGKEPRFELLSAEYTGINFQNNLVETPQMNIFTYLYFYNGGGVAAGDLNGDGLPDLYFTSNLESNRLYLNRGEFKFIDVTETSKVEGKSGWTTGVTMADVNGDGKLDIYVSQLGDYKNIRGKNQLFINTGNDDDGVPVFEDQAKQYGLDLVGFSTQAVFFDYDLDGDLDMYMLNHSVHSNGTFVKADIRKEKHPLSGDKLLRNDGGTFTDVTDSSGIHSSVLGYGLGITVSDINGDGYPDIYVGNDFHEDDYLYINNGDGTFREALSQCIQHTSRFSMGNDIGDINNDGFEDIISLDMLPADPVMLKTAAGEDGYDVYNYKLNYGYSHQFARNTLQLNLGNGKFSEIALLSEVYATDWSWSGLFADLDLDGYKDIYVANGIKRRSNDMDYIKYISNDAIQQRLEGDLTDEDLALVEKMPVVKIPNYAFRNNGDLTFSNASEDWGLGQNSFSNGAIYADLDNDGDLDLVVNNIDEKAFVYRNNTITEEKKGNNFLKVKFKGLGANPFGIGSRVIVPTESDIISHQSYTTRGFQSAVPSELVIGLGKRGKIDSLVVIWPNQSYQVLTNVPVNQTIEVKQSEASGKFEYAIQPDMFFEDVTEKLPLSYKHAENKFIEFNREALIPHMASTEGPKLAVGDVNGDGLQDFYIGGAKRQAGELYLQTDKGFERSKQPSFQADSLHEDTDAAFIDVDNDGDLDLIVTSGGNEFRLAEDAMLVRLYRNDGQGRLIRDRSALQDVFVNASCVRHADFDHDGDEDLFIGGRVVPWNYGEVPRSYILQNDGKGNFKDVTGIIGGEDLELAGMVKDAVWADIDNDGDQDLVLAGEWMPITIFTNESNKLMKADPKDFGLEASQGWWNTILVTDINSDGNPDIIAGNLGLNSKLKASPKLPLEMYVNDYDKNGNIDQLLFCYIGDKQHLFATKDEIAKQLVGIKKKFVNYTDFAYAGFPDIVSKDDIKKSITYKAVEMRSGIFINDGNGRFIFHAFPVSAQVSPINSLVLTDYDGDGNDDLIAGGNFYEVNIQRGRYDASYGLLLKSLGDGSFSVIPNRQSGIEIEGQVRDMEWVNLNGRKLLLVARNNASLQIITQK